MAAVKNWLTGNERVELAYPSRIGVGDYFEYGGEIVRCITKQSNLPSMSSNKPFTMFTVVTVNGAIFPADDVHGLKRVWRG